MSRFWSLFTVAFVCQYYGPFQIEESKFSLQSRSRCCFGDEPVLFFFITFFCIINSLLELLKEMKFVCLFVKMLNVPVNPPPLTPKSETLPQGHHAPLKDNEVVQKRRRSQQMNSFKN